MIILIVIVVVITDVLCIKTFLLDIVRFSFSFFFTGSSDATAVSFKFVGQVKKNAMIKKNLYV